MKNNSFPEMSTKKYNRISTVQSLAILIAMIVIFMCNFKIAIVPSSSMYPTLQVREFLFCVNDKNYDYDDIVIFHPYPNDSQYYVKRVIGLSGDKIEVKDGCLYRNDEIVTADYTNEQTIYYTMPAVIVPDGEYFMMGDNRNNSGDSHVLGTISKTQCVGTVLLHAIPWFWSEG